jgi:hypothetical protein
MNPKEMLEHARKVRVERSKNNIIYLQTILLDELKTAYRTPMSHVPFGYFGYEAEEDPGDWDDDFYAWDYPEF